MPFSIHFEKRDAMVTAIVEGYFDSIAATKLALAVKKFAAEHECGRILLDMRKVKLTICVYDICLMMKNVNKIGCDNLCKKAILAKNGFSNFSLLEWLAQNGGHKIKLFTKSNAARRWLTDKPLAQHSENNQIKRG